ncbi:MAG: hypothetical protein AAF689_05560 [Pseudomonadota bacterium]
MDHLVAQFAAKMTDVFEKNAVRIGVLFALATLGAFVVERSPETIGQAWESLRAFIR